MICPTSQRKPGSELPPYPPKLPSPSPSLYPPKTDLNARGAAREVYDILELRRKIFGLIDKPTLGGMMRLEKDATASVAEELYRMVHVTQIDAMSREDPRRTVYCDAVRKIDLSPLPVSLIDQSLPTIPPAYGSYYLDPPSMEQIATWRSKFPRLHTILRRYPQHKEADSYAIRIMEDAIHLHLESYVEFHTDEYDICHDGPPELPLAPVYEGFVVHHTLAISIVSMHPDDEESDMDFDEDDETSEEEIMQWKSWLFCNPDLDKRVTSINVDLAYPPMDISLDEYMSFLSERRRLKCEPMRKLYLRAPLTAADLAPVRMRQIAKSFGPKIRVLEIEVVSNKDSKSWSKTIAILDRALPLLQGLTISIQRRWQGPTTATKPLTGMVNLRKFEILRVNASDPLVFARWVHKLGSPICTHMSRHSLAAVDAPSCVISFNALTRKLRSPRPEYAYLHQIQSRDFDIQRMSDLNHFVTEAVDGKPRRIAWTFASNLDATLSDRDDSLNALLEQQRTASTSLRQICLDTKAGLKAAEGDLAGQKDVIRQEYKKTGAEVERLKRACIEMRGVLAEIERDAAEAAERARAWLKNEELAVSKE